MIALLLVMLHQMLIGLIFGLVVGAGLVLTTAVIDIIHGIVLTPIAMVLMRKVMVQAEVTFNMGALLAKLYKKMEPWVVALLALVKATNRYHGSTTPDGLLAASFLETVPGENPFSGTLFRIKMAIKNHEVPKDLEAEIRRVFAYKATNELVELYAGSKPVLSADPAILERYEELNIPVVLPTYLPASADVDADYIVGFVQSLAKCGKVTGDLAKEIISGCTCSKATLYYLHELTYLLTGEVIGKFLTPYLYREWGQGLIKRLTTEAVAADYTREELKTMPRQKLEAMAGPITNPNLFLSITSADMQSMLLAKFEAVAKKMLRDIYEVAEMYTKSIIDNPEFTAEFIRIKQPAVVQLSNPQTKTKEVRYVPSDI